MWTLLAVYIDLPGQQVTVGFKMLTQAAAGAGTGQGAIYRGHKSPRCTQGTGQTLTITWSNPRLYIVIVHVPNDILSETASA